MLRWFNNSTNIFTWITLSTAAFVTLFYCYLLSGSAPEYFEKLTVWLNYPPFNTLIPLTVILIDCIAIGIAILRSSIVNQTFKNLTTINRTERLHREDNKNTSNNEAKNRFLFRIKDIETSSFEAYQSSLLSLRKKLSKNIESQQKNNQQAKKNKRRNSSKQQVPEALKLLWLRQIEFVNNKLASVDSEFYAAMATRHEIARSLRIFKSEFPTLKIWSIQKQLRQGYTKQAELLLDKVINEPSSVLRDIAAHMAGRLCETHADIQTAFFYYRRAAEISGDNMQYARLAGLTAVIVNQPHTAQKWLQHYIELHELSKPADTQLAEALHELASTYASLGNYNIAIDTYQQAAVLRKELQSASHVDYAATLNNLANCYKKNKRYQRAEELYREALSIIVRCYGENHRAVAMVLNNLAGALKAQAKDDEALSICTRTMHIYQSTDTDQQSSGLEIIKRNYQAILTGIDKHYQHQLFNAY